MKRIHLLLLVMVLLSAASAQVVHAQAGIPPTSTGPLGEIHGTVINRNSGKAVPESLEVMLHVLDLNYADLDMDMDNHNQMAPLCLPMSRSTPAFNSL